MTGVRLLDHWSPPDGAGAPVACLATTFTFEADFFAQDCLSRFLSLSSIVGEGDSISSIAAVLEEEDRLSEAQVSVLVDRSSPAEKRNLRWDVLPVAVPGGLLHAKVAALLWERSARLILGSANLTAAGYRRQIELALAIDLDENCLVPRPVLDELVLELRRLAGLAPGDVSGPKTRALATVDLLASRVEALDLPLRAGRDLRMAVAPARPGVSPLSRLHDVWHGGQPLRATILSPYWDDDERALAVTAVRKLLTGRPASQRWLKLITAIDPYTGAVQAPSSLAGQPGASVMNFDPPDDERRTLHAKLLLVEGDDWLAAMIGSSNATSAGLGLHPTNGHHELNVWLGCPPGSRAAKHLRSLARPGDPLALSDEVWTPDQDEDEPRAPILPLGFVTCMVHPGTPPRAQLSLDPTSLPEAWEVRSPVGAVVLTPETWRAGGRTGDPSVELPDKALPAYLIVSWTADGLHCEATWTANVEDRSALPPPSELSDLPVDILLAALASTRPLPVALEHELRRHTTTTERRVELDPLRRFDDRGLLLQRARHLSLALWRLQERLGRPASNLDALHWRLHGPFGPLAIGDGLLDLANANKALPGEAHFLLAELALTVAHVDWTRVADDIDDHHVQGLVADVLGELDKRRRALPAAPDKSIDAYLDRAFAEARQ
jgi:hypothetical protein